MALVSDTRARLRPCGCLLHLTVFAASSA